MGYIMKDEGRTKFQIDKWGIPGHPKAAPTRLLQWCYLNVAASICLPQWICKQWGNFNEAASINLNKAMIEVTWRKCCPFCWHYTFVVPHSPRLDPQACLSCLRQLETLNRKQVKESKTTLGSKMLSVVVVLCLVLDEYTFNRNKKMDKLAREKN